MRIITVLLVILAFCALVSTGVHAWQCMKLTRGDADDPALLTKRLRGLGFSLLGLLLFGCLHLLLSLFTGGAA